MKKHEFIFGILFFLLVAYPIITVMTKVKGRGGMFIWRNKLRPARGAK